jgi:hypothetical protein
VDSDVVQLIKALRAGSIGLDDVAQRFRERAWPLTKKAPSTDYIEMAVRDEEDPEPDVPGSFDEVVAAYYRGELTRAEYRALADAVADSIRAAEYGDA